MNEHPFRKHLERAIESRLPLAEVDFSEFESDSQDRAFFEQQAQLDQVISLWKAHHVRTGRRRRSRNALAGVSLLAAGILGVALLNPPKRYEAGSEVESPAIVSVDVVETDVSPETIATVLEPAVAPLPEESEQYAAATVTAGRLAYALQPVGEHVSSVVQLLIDAVPGSEVFAL